MCFQGVSGEAEHRCCVRPPQTDVIAEYYAGTRTAVKGPEVGGSLRHSGGGGGGGGVRSHKVAPSWRWSAVSSWDL